MRIKIYQYVRTFNGPSRNRRYAASAATLLLVACLPQAGLAQERGPHSLRLEGAAAASLDDGETIGGGFGGGYEYRVLDSLGIAGSFVGDLFTDEEAGVPDGIVSYRGLDGRIHEVEADGVVYPSTKLRYFGIGVGPRVHALPASKTVDLWLGTGVKYVRLREESRVGLDVGVGADFRFGDGGLSIGSFVRYTQVIQPEDGAAGGDDDRFLQLGAALSWGGASTPTRRREFESAISSAPEELSDVPEELSSVSDELSNEPEQSSGEAEAASERKSKLASVSEPEVAPETELQPASQPADSDADSIPDAKDACPNEAGVAEEAGCPAKPAATSQPARTQAVDLPTQVAFGGGAKTVTRRGARSLREVLDVLKSDATIRSVLVVGHADDRGSAELNMALSQERAQAVVAWLVAHGVESGRLQAVGRGASEPRVEGQSKEARRANRRVEFVVTDPSK